MQGIFVLALVVTWVLFWPERHGSYVGLWNSKAPVLYWTPRLPIRSRPRLSFCRLELVDLIRIYICDVWSVVCLVRFSQIQWGEEKEGLFVTLLVLASLKVLLTSLERDRAVLFELPCFFVFGFLLAQEVYGLVTISTSDGTFVIGMSRFEGRAFVFYTAATLAYQLVIQPIIYGIRMANKAVTKPVEERKTEPAPTQEKPKQQQQPVVPSKPVHSKGLSEAHISYIALFKGSPVDAAKFVADKVTDWNKQSANYAIAFHKNRLDKWARDLEWRGTSDEFVQLVAGLLQKEFSGWKGTQDQLRDLTAIKLFHLEIQPDARISKMISNHGVPINVWKERMGKVITVLDVGWESLTPDNRLILTIVTVLPDFDEIIVELSNVPVSKRMEQVNQILESVMSSNNSKS